MHHGKPGRDMLPLPYLHVERAAGSGATKLLAQEEGFSVQTIVGGLLATLILDRGWLLMYFFLPLWGALRVPTST